jgi:hypothetical protein
MNYRPFGRLFLLLFSCDISNAPNPKRWSMVEKMREASRLIEDFTKTDKHSAPSRRTIKG